MRTFRFSAPRTVEEACGLLREGSARVLAGGSDLIVQMRSGRREVDHVIDLKGVAELMQVTEGQGGVQIGGAVSITTMTAHPAMSRHPALVRSARMIGSYQIQNRASIGGNVCNAAPSADAIPALMCLGARAVIAGPEGRREMAVEDIFVGPGRTTLDPAEILVALHLPPPAGSAACYFRFTPRREMDIAVAGAAAWLRLGSDGHIADARVALASVAPTPIRAREAEAGLIGEKPSESLFREAARLAAREARPISDTRGSADYRRELVNTLTARALANCVDQLGSAAAA